MGPGTAHGVFPVVAGAVIECGVSARRHKGERLFVGDIDNADRGHSMLSCPGQIG
jgi:hypothetical protein